MIDSLTWDRCIQSHACKPDLQARQEQMSQAYAISNLVIDGAELRMCYSLQCPEAGMDSFSQILQIHTFYPAVVPRHAISANAEPRQGV